MVRTPSVDKNGIKKGAWSEEEDNILRAFVERHGHRNWRQLPKFAGLPRCGKSCRLRWLNYLKPGLKKGPYSKDEEELIIKLREELGNKWSVIASKLPGRTDNEIKNHWHTHLSKRMKQHPKSTWGTEEEGKMSDQIHLAGQKQKGSPSILKSDQLPQHIGWDPNADDSSTDISSSISKLTISSHQEFEPSNAEPCGIFWNEILPLDSSRTQILHSGSCNSAIFDGANLSKTIAEPSENFWGEPFLLDASDSLISTSSSCNSAILVDEYKIPEETLPLANGDFWREPFLMDSSNSQNYPPNCEELHARTLESLRSEPLWLGTFYDESVLSSSPQVEGFDLPFSSSADGGYDLFNSF